MSKLLSRVSIKALLLVVLVVGITLLSPLVLDNVNNYLSEHNYPIITIGLANTAYAKAPDTQVDGTADDVQVQAALNALPSTGGKIILYAGNYTFDATVSRAINNVTIEGSGLGTVINHDGVTALFSAGSQSGWAFRNFKTDAGGITLSSATNYRLENILIGTTNYPASVRNGSLLVASNNATTLEKSQADYVCDGTADDVEIQAAIDFANASSYNTKIIKLTAGMFTLDATLTLADGVILEGTGSSTQIWVPPAETFNAITATSSYYVTIRDLMIYSSAIRDTGYGIYLNQANNTYLNNVVILNQSTGIYSTDSTIVWVNNSQIREFKVAGITVNGSLGAFTIFNVVMDNASAPTTAGIYVTDCDSLQIDQCNIIRSKYGLKVDGSVGGCYSIMASNTFFDNNQTDGCILSSGAGGNVYRAYFDNCWFSSSDANGVTIWNGNNIKFVNCHFNLNATYGIQCAANTTTDLFVADSEFLNNGTGGNGAGIVIPADMKDFIINNNRFGSIAYESNAQQGLGVYITAGNSTRYEICNNNFYSPSLAQTAITDGGTGAIKNITNNLYFNPTGAAATTPAIPASTAYVQNTLGYPVQIVMLTAGTCTAVNIKDRAGTIQQIRAAVAQWDRYLLQPEEQIAITYSGAPTWKWLGQ